MTDRQQRKIDKAWRRFEKSGGVADYMAYAQLKRAAEEDL